MNVGYVYDKKMTLHSCETSEHPECPDRIIKIFEKLKNSGLTDKMKHIVGRNATTGELLIVHKPKYLKTLKKYVTGCAEFRRKLESLCNSVYFNQYTLESASFAVGSSIELLSNIILDDLKYGIALVRPPGHHAFRNKCGGFCIYNTVAILAKIAANNDLKVGIFDWDVHHGDGTENIVKDIDNIKFISIQRYDDGNFYPSTGKSKQIDNVIDVGFNGSINDSKYRKLFNENVVATFADFKPNIIIISCGFDAAKGDTLGECDLSPEFYGEMTDELKKISEKLLFVLEGGYNLDTISNCMYHVANSLLK